MKKRNLLVGLFSMLGLVTMGNSMFAQQNLGAACGCPSVATRTIEPITNLGSWTNLPAAAYGKELTSGNITLTCDKIWTLDEKLYIGSGATITIEPGTVIKGSVAPNVAAARALIIERGGKIIAPGTEDCPIVFTAVDDPMNGSYGVMNKGKWGGVLICGKATNNLTLAANGPFVPGQGGKMAVADGLGVLEGFASSYPQDQFGAAQSTPVGYVQSSYPAATPGNDNDYTFNLPAANGISGSNVNGQKVITLGANAPVYVVAGQLVKLGSIELGRVSSVSSANVTLQFNMTTLTAAITSNDQITFSGDYTGTGSAFFPTFASTPVSGAPTASNPNAGNPSTSLAFINYVAPSVPAGTGFDDNDNSGVMTYVSIRYSGANLLVGSEINGLTLASVGRGTKIEHIEIVSCADDNIELFGGTVDLKYCTTLFGNDDMYDYDLGWSGRGQFLFGMKAPQAAGTTGSTGAPAAGANAISYDNDNGFECDSDDNTSNAFPKSNPKIYNATILGNTKTAGTADNRAVSAINMKEGAQGTIANSIFAQFNNGFNLENSLTNRTTQGNSFQFWSTIPQSVSGTLNALEGIGTTPTPSLLVKCNHFVGITNPFIIGASTIAGTTTVTTPAAATTQFGTDGNVIVVGNTLAGFNYSFNIDGSTNVVSQKNDVVPNPAVALGSGCTQAPMDGFFEPANYRGAFSSTAGDNWLSDWSYSQVLGATSGVAACPTDLNGDGITNTADFLIFAPAFGTSCN
jgi:hypothetical protein